MSGGAPDHVCELLIQSLEAWQVSGEVRREVGGTLLLIAGSKRLGISRTMGDHPFRWMVTEGERSRGVTSIAGLLRNVRAAVDPDYRPVRLRLAPLPLVPP